MMPGTRAAPGPVDRAVAAAVSRFGGEVGPKLRKRVGNPEEQLREPFSRFVREVGDILGVKVDTYGEASLPTLGIRPDYVVDAAGARVGYVELKRPGRGVPTTWSPNRRERAQWGQLSLLPNVLYTDGEQWAVYRYGEIVGRVAKVSCPLERASTNLTPVDGQLARVLADFLLWKPDPPRTLNQLVRAVAKLCRLLRHEVSDTLVREQHGEEAHAVFTGLASDWRRLLFPDLPDEGFADAYAQTVTFALLLARLDGIVFDGKDLPEIARQLGKKHSLMGKALAVLTEDAVEGRSIVVPTLLRVIGAVDWEITGSGSSDSYLHLYEHFLAEYDEELRERSGSYYTPDEVVTFMVGFVDELLRAQMDRVQMDEEWGLAAEDVFVIDPAMGTGTFLLSVIERVAGTIADAQGPGAVPGELRDLFKRLIGFEKQAGPYAVAELRIHQALKTEHSTEIPESEARLYLADTLGNPYDDLTTLSGMDAIARSRREANKVKLSTPVMVVIGNPPYDAKAKNQGGWIEAGAPNDGRAVAPLTAFRAVGNGRYEYVLNDLYVYFWRWATWKVFDAHPEHPAGIVAFISPKSYTTGQGYAGMREYLRKTADEGWVIDVSPEGLRPDVPTRVFPGVQNPLCIGIFLRRGAPDDAQAATVHYRALHGHRDEKLRQLTAVKADDDGWETCAYGWQAPFAPASSAVWESYPALGDLMPWHSPGIKPNRTWVYAPDADVLKTRWNRLIAADIADKAKLYKENDPRVGITVPPLPGYPQASGPIGRETGPCPNPARVAYRAFDRQWIIPDNRLLERSRPDLWRVRQAPGQVFTVEQHSKPLTEGPGLVFAAYPPDMDNFQGSQGGRVLPLYRDARGMQPNIAPGLLAELGRRLAISTPTPQDLLAYIAAVTAHPSYTARFAHDLKTPGVRVPLTAVPELWAEAVTVGSEIIWLHTYGREFADPAAGRPFGAPRLPDGLRPLNTVPIPHAADEMPEEITYDAGTRTLCIGAGQVRPVREEVWEYQTSGMRVVKKWFDYRRRDPAGRRSSPLDDLNAERWTATFTRELLELLRVLTRCIELEPSQAELLDRICQGALICTADLAQAEVLPPSKSTRRPVPAETQDVLF
jgi:Type ISP C-terminal specificity domain/N-6 DNA Methylase